MNTFRLDYKRVSRHEEMNTGVPRLEEVTSADEDRVYGQRYGVDGE